MQFIISYISYRKRISPVLYRIFFVKRRTNKSVQEATEELPVLSINLRKREGFFYVVRV